MRINKYQLENRRGERQHQVKRDWTINENIVTVYDCVYDVMMDAKLAIFWINQSTTSSIYPEYDSRHGKGLEDIRQRII